MPARRRCVTQAPCCVGGPPSHRLARRFSTAAASILPTALLVLLPKCPLCLAAWLTVATGIGFSTAGAEWARAMLVVLWIAAVAFAAAAIIRRRAFRRSLVVASGRSAGRWPHATPAADRRRAQYLPPWEWDRR